MSNYFLDLTQLVEQRELASDIDMKELVERRHQLAMLESAARKGAEERREIDNEIQEYLQTHNVPGLVLDGIEGMSGRIIVSIVTRRSPGKWDGDKLNTFLSPRQIEQAYTSGEPKDSLRSEINAKKLGELDFKEIEN